MAGRLPAKSSIEAQQDAFIAWLYDADKEMAWGSGIVLDGFNLTRKDGGWFLVIKGRSSAGEHVVTFCAGPSITDTWRNLYWLNKAGELRWKPDKYAK